MSSTLENTTTEEPPIEVFQEVEAFGLPTTILVAELQRRGYQVQDMTHYDEATGLLKYEGDSTYYFDNETHKMVSGEVAYERATKGW